MQKQHLPSAFLVVDNSTHHRRDPSHARRLPLRRVIPRDDSPPLVSAPVLTRAASRLTPVSDQHTVRACAYIRIHGPSHHPPHHKLRVAPAASSNCESISQP